MELTFLGCPCVEPRRPNGTNRLLNLLSEFLSTAWHEEKKKNLKDKLLVPSGLAGPLLNSCVRLEAVCLTGSGFIS